MQKFPSRHLKVVNKEFESIPLLATSKSKKCPKIVRLPLAVDFVSNQNFEKSIDNRRIRREIARYNLFHSNLNSNKKKE